MASKKVLVNNVCHKCGQEGHSARECPTGSRAGTVEDACHNCGTRGHISRDCPQAERDKSNQRTETSAEGEKSDRGGGDNGLRDTPRSLQRHNLVDVCLSYDGENFRPRVHDTYPRYYRFGINGYEKPTHIDVPRLRQTWNDLNLRLPDEHNSRHAEAWQQFLDSSKEKERRHVEVTFIRDFTMCRRDLFLLYWNKEGPLGKPSHVLFLLGPFPDVILKWIEASSVLVEGDEKWHGHMRRCYLKYLWGQYSGSDDNFFLGRPVAFEVRKSIES